ncbi:pseudouridine synthase [Hyphomicrobium methylovorum]|uniref:pseudouridine synthase n=1 Tax=Hyphomicrobium methylovorum TaxID=84 RepID=UPI001FE558D0|nr:pseudouridine synthase [Hyphomicrobium methylovorum]
MAKPAQTPAKTQASKPSSANTGRDEPMRIAKAMARAGLCSRREAERWIADGRVSVNGKLLKTPAVEVSPGDKIIVDGKPLPAAAPPQLWRYHKPKGIVTTHADPGGRPTVFEKMPPEMPRVISVGRLDFNTEGLLLLTNDGALARHLELPANGWVRRYRARAKGRVSPADLANLKDGVEIDGIKYGPIEAAVDSVQGANTWLSISIREGKNREVRNVLAHLGLTVSRLIRVSFGPFQLLDLAPGAVEAVRRRVLVAQLGPKAAEALGFSESQVERKARHARGRAASGSNDE